MVNYLHDTDKAIYFKMPFGNSQSSYIYKLCFANSCDLYVLCHENNDRQHDKKIVIHRLRVGMDCSIELREGMSRTTQNEIFNIRKS